MHNSAKLFSNATAAKVSSGKVSLPVNLHSNY